MHSLPAGAAPTLGTAQVARGTVSDLGSQPGHVRVSQLGAGGCSELDTGDARGSQCLSGCSQRCACGDDVVDDEHAESGAWTPGAKRGTGKTLGTGLARLRISMGPVQQPTAGNAELAGDRLGNGLGLVVAPAAHVASAGWRPGHHVDRGETQTTHHLGGKDHGRRPAVTELQGDDQFPRHTVEREGSSDAVGAANWADRGQREPTAMAQGLARASASRATSTEQPGNQPGNQPRKHPRKHHGAINTRRV